MKQPAAIKPNLERLTCHLRQIARERNWQTSPRSLKEIQSYVREEFLSYGFEVREDPFSFAGQSFSNVVARLPRPGSESEEARFIVGAHFDSVSGSPGADDNASGVACLLETAHLYAGFRKEDTGVPRGLHPWDGWDSTRGAVEFAAFNLEEYGMIGSRAYAEKLKKERIRVAGMLSLEMVGYVSQERKSQKMPLLLKPFFPDVGNFIGLAANTRSKTLLEKVKKIFENVRGLPVESLILPARGGVFPAARLSDHSPFWDEGFPALLVTDTSFYRNPHYHSGEDRVETLNLDFLAKVTEATAQTALLSIRS